jgi:threonine/homoserine/homoserine lactone efflux protein
MAEVIGEIVGLAIGIAVSPVPIAAVILMLFASKARVTGPSFLAGWIIGITLVVTVVLFIPGLDSDSGEPSTTTGVIKGILGLLLLAVAARQWVSRPAPDDEVPMPKWMKGVDTMGGGSAFGLALLLTVANPKNLVLAAAAGAEISAAQLDTQQTVLAIAVFAIVASITIAIPVIGYLIAGDRIQPALDSTKDWMIQNNTAIMSVLLLVFGVILLGDAISILLT